MKRLFLLSLLLFSLALPCYGMEITEQEIYQLENNLNKLEIINQTSQAELVKLNTELTIAKNQLSTLKMESVKQEQLLLTANKSLQEYGQEMKKKTSRLKMQRNIAYTLCAVLLIKVVNE